MNIFDMREREDEGLSRPIVYGNIGDIETFNDPDTGVEHLILPLDTGYQVEIPYYELRKIKDYLRERKLSQ